MLPVRQAEAVRGESAVLAVDSLDITLPKDDSQSLRDSFEQAAIKQMATVQQTYKTWAQQRPELMGTLVLNLTIDGDGNVTRVDSVASRMTDRSFADTVITDAGKWKFPQGAENAQIRAPLFFVPRGMDPASVVYWERNVTLTERTVPAMPDPTGAESSPDRKRDDSDNLKPAQPRVAAANKAVRPAASAAEARRPTAVAAITNRPITLRESPLFSARKLSNAETGVQASILERRGDWVKLRLKDSGITGFVRKEFVSPAD